VEQPVDLATIAADDAMLDVVGRGESGPEADQMTAMLLAWRSEIADGDDDVDSNAELIRTALASDGTPATALAMRSYVSRRLLRAAAGVVVAAVLATGLAVGSNYADPGSALWPVTKVLYPERAEVRAAEHAIDRARAAVAAGEYDEVQRLLDEARRHLARVDDKVVAERLHAEVDAVLRDLPAVSAPEGQRPGDPGQQAPAPAPSAPGTPSGGGPAPTGNPNPPGDRDQKGPAPAPSDRESERQILPEIDPVPPEPRLPVPPVPIPSPPQLPLPPPPSPPLPSLPLQSDDLLD
jgi:hypothetical protein